MTAREIATAFGTKSNVDFLQGHIDALVHAEREACCRDMCGLCHSAANGGEFGPAKLAEGGGLYVHARPVTGSKLLEWIPCRADAIRRRP